jgi:hypothetical protein
MGPNLILKFSTQLLCFSIFFQNFVSKLYAKIFSFPIFPPKFVIFYFLQICTYDFLVLQIFIQIFCIKYICIGKIV